MPIPYQTLWLILMIFILSDFSSGAHAFAAVAESARNTLTSSKSSAPFSPPPKTRQTNPPELPPWLSGEDAYRLLTSQEARYSTIQWLYSGDETLKPPLTKAQKINWQSFVYTNQDGIRWVLKDQAQIKDRLIKDFRLDPSQPVVVFGDSITKFLVLSSGWGEEGRIAWMLQTAGFNQVAVVDGGYEAIMAKSGTLALAGQFNVVEDSPPKAIGFAELAKQHQTARDDHVVVDTRSWDEYRGLKSYVGKKGRIQGARHFHVDDFFDSRGKLRSKAELSRELAKRGIDGKRPIVTYCSGGVRSAMAYYVLRYHLGFPEVANYDGSWAEWSRRYKD